MHKLAKPPHASGGYDFCSSTHCQAYKGAGEESAASNGAVDATHGQVLAANGSVIDAVYHHACGGVTAGSEDVWSGPPEEGLVPVFDRPGDRGIPSLATDEAVVRLLADTGSTFCNSAAPNYPNYAKKYFRWQKTLDAAALAKACGVGRVRDIIVEDRRPSGRVRRLRVSGDAGTHVIEKDMPIRDAFDLWSSLFVISVNRSGGYIQSATFTGGGNGHGVGLCQMGARTMALTGAGYRQILAHYYRGAQLAQLR